MAIIQQIIFLAMLSVIKASVVDSIKKSITSYAVVQRGGCPSSVKALSPFDLNDYLGKWYEIRRYPNSFQRGLKCVTAEYSLNEDGDVKVDNQGVAIDGGELSQAIGTATISDPKVAKLKVSFSRFAPAGNYWVLDTDYENYSIVWSCQSLYFFNIQALWILARENTLPEATLQRIYSTVEDAGITTSNFLPKTVQDCSN